MLVSFVLLILSSIIPTSFALDLPYLESLWKVAYSTRCNQSYLPVPIFKCSSCNDSKDVDLRQTHIYSSFENKTTNDAGFVAINHVRQEIYIAFRSSIKNVNIMQDINIIHNEKCFDYLPEGALVHGGFCQGWKSLRGILLPKMLKLIRTKRDYKVRFVGHSLGATMAVLAAVEVDQILKLTSRIKVITFGQPRLGNTEFAVYLQSVFGERLFRIVQYLKNQGDPIPHLPFAWMGFAHSANQYNYKDGALTECKIDEIQGDNPQACLGKFVFDMKKHKEYFGITSTCE